MQKLHLLCLIRLEHVALVSCGMPSVGPFVVWGRGAAAVCEALLSSFTGTSHVDAEFADICDAVSATQRIKHKTRLLFNKKHAPQLVSRSLQQTVLVACPLTQGGPETLLRIRRRCLHACSSAL